MATFTTTTDRFPAGTTVTVYPASNWPTAGLPPSGAPVGSSTTSAAVGTDSTLTFTGLAAGTTYYMTASVGGSYRYVQFRTQATSGRVLTDNGYEEQSALVIPKYDIDNGQAGMYAPNAPAAGLAAITLSANRAYLGRFVPSRSMTITSISFALSTVSGTDDPCDVGIYDSSFAKIVTSGATSGKLNGSTGAKNIAISSTTLTAGTVYYTAFAANSTASVMGVTMGSAGGATLFGTAAPQIECAFKDASYTLPSSLSGATLIANVPLMALRES